MREASTKADLQTVAVFRSLSMPSGFSMLTCFSVLPSLAVLPSFPVGTSSIYRGNRQTGPARTGVRLKTREPESG